MPPKSLTDKALYLIVLNLFRYSIAFLLPVFLVRLLPMEDYGAYQQVVLVGNMTSSIVAMGITFSIYYFFTIITQDQRKALISQTFFILCGLGMIAVLFLVGLAPKLSRYFSNPLMKTILPPYAMTVLFMLCSDYFMTYHIVSELYTRGVTYEVTSNLVRVAGMVLSAFYMGIYGLIMFLLAYSLVRCMVFNGRIWMDMRGWPGPAFDRKLALSQVKYSFPLGLSRIVGTIGNETDKLIIASFYDPSKYAVYATGAIELPFDTIFQSSVTNILHSKIPSLYARRDISEIVKIWRNSIRKLSLIIAPFFGYLLFFSSDLIPFVFTKAYAESAVVFKIYLFLLPTHAIPFSVIPISTGKTKEVSWISSTSIAMNVLLSLLFIPLFNYYGPAIACNCSIYIGDIIFLIISARILGTRVLELFPGRLYLSAFGISTLLGWLCWLGRGIFPDIMGIILFSTLYLVVVPVFYYIFGVMEPSDINYVIGRWTKRFAA